MKLDVPNRLRLHAKVHPRGGAWLESLPSLVARLAETWQLSLDPPLVPGGTASLVLPARRADGSPAVLKVGLPHMEAREEIAGLRFWDGEPTVRVFEAAPDLCASLLERCEPGVGLASEPLQLQDEVIVELLPELWRAPPDPSPFRSLTTLLSSWTQELESDPVEWKTPPLIQAAHDVLVELATSLEHEVLLATDLHAGNVLRAGRRPWLVIDPKPFVGDRPFDLLQHLLNHPHRLLTDLAGVTTRLANPLRVDADRLRRWLFVRIVLGPVAGDQQIWNALARSLAP